MTMTMTMDHAPATYAAPSAPAPSRRTPPPARLVSVHGDDPLTGYPVTWHITSLAQDGAAGAYLIERADGDIRSPAVWMQAQRQAAIVGGAEVLALIGQVMGVDPADG